MMAHENNRKLRGLSGKGRGKGKGTPDSDLDSETASEPESNTTSLYLYSNEMTQSTKAQTLYNLK
jgi:hypothetical protein